MTAVVLSAVLSAGCYSTAQLRVQVQVASTDGVTCVDAIDRTFAEAGFERVRSVMTGPDMFYTPRTSPGSSVRLEWGIGAWLNHDDPNHCALAIEAISADPAPAPPPPGIKPFRIQTFGMYPYSTQRGEPFDKAVRDMAHRLELASARGS